MAVRAFDNRLGCAKRNKWDPENMHKCPGRAWLKHAILAALRALLRRRGRPVVVANDLARAKENDHGRPRCKLCSCILCTNMLPKVNSAAERLRSHSRPYGAEISHGADRHRAL